eukprot:2956750-Rhodomonas_salina.1
MRGGVREAAGRVSAVPDAGPPDRGPSAAGGAAARRYPLRSGCARAVPCLLLTSRVPMLAQPTSQSPSTPSPS